MDTVTSADIVYINQATSGFDAQTQCLLSSNPADGVYIVLFGGTGDMAEVEKFYIGMAADAEMTRIDGTDGYSQICDTYNIGYTATVNLSGGYKSIIIKKADEKYMGCAIPTTLTGGRETTIGIQINDAESLEDIEGVWLSARTISGNTASTAAAQ